MGWRPRSQAGEHFSAHERPVWQYGFETRFVFAYDETGFPWPNIACFALYRTRFNLFQAPTSTNPSGEDSLAIAFIVNPCVPRRVKHVELARIKSEW